MLTIDGGTFSGGKNTVKNDDGAVLVINGGSFNNTSQAVVLNWNYATVNGGTFTTGSTASQSIVNRIDPNNRSGETVLNNGVLTVNGGTFDKPIGLNGTNKAAIADGVNVSVQVCVSGAFVDAVAKIDNEYFVALMEAFAAAPTVGEQEDQTVISLLSDSSGSGIKLMEASSKNIAVDFGGHTYTISNGPVGSTGYESQAFHLERGSTVVLYNGKITSTNDSGASMLVQNYCDLTLRDMVLDGTNLGTNGYTLSNNNGTVTVIGSKIIASANNVAFDVYGNFNSYVGPSVSVTNSEIEGTIEVAVDSNNTRNSGTVQNLTLGPGTSYQKVSVVNLISGTTDNVYVKIAESIYGADKVTCPEGHSFVLLDGYYVLQKTASETEPEEA